MKHLSIIIPIYNVEPYLERCLRSLEDQDIPQHTYEIICINDGSKDNSGHVVKRLQAEFENIQLIEQENQGVSMARNKGIDIATGRYLLFIDPDDYVDSSSFSRILKNADQNDIQVSFLGFTILNEDGTVRKRTFNEDLPSTIYGGHEAYLVTRRKGSIDPDRTWAVLFRRDFMDKYKLRYLPRVPYLEDGELVARILCLAERCFFDQHSFYQRTSRPGSATHSNLFTSEKATEGFLLAAKNLAEFRENTFLALQQKSFMNRPLIKFVLLVVISSGYNRIGRSSKALKDLGLKKLNTQNCTGYFYINGKIYNLSPFMCLISLNLYPKIIKSFESIESFFTFHE